MKPPGGLNWACIAATLHAAWSECLRVTSFLSDGLSWVRRFAAYPAGRVASSIARMACRSARALYRHGCCMFRASVPSPNSCRHEASSDISPGLALAMRSASSCPAQVCTDSAGNRMVCWGAPQVAFVFRISSNISHGNTHGAAAATTTNLPYRPSRCQTNCFGRARR